MPRAVAPTCVVVPELALSVTRPRICSSVRPSWRRRARRWRRWHAPPRACSGGEAAPAPALLVGFPEALEGAPTGRAVANSAALIDGGQIVAVVRKSLLPTYDVFDEWRYFEPATDVAPVDFRGRRLGISICEDIWNDTDFWPHRLYRPDPIETLVARGAEIIINIVGVALHHGEAALRPRMLAATARRWRRPLVFVNQVGGQDDLVFDGASLVLDARRRGDRARPRAREPT